MEFVIALWNFVLESPEVMGDAAGRRLMVHGWEDTTCSLRCCKLYLLPLLLGYSFVKTGVREIPPGEELL